MNNSLETFESFDYDYYIKNNQDVLRVYGNKPENIWKHWEKYGYKENRIHRFVKQLSLDYNNNYYDANEIHFINVPLPSDPTDVCSKLYVDNVIGSAVIGNYLPFNANNKFNDAKSILISNPDEGCLSFYDNNIHGFMLSLKTPETDNIYSRIILSDNNDNLEIVISNNIYLKRNKDIIFQSTTLLEKNSTYFMSLYTTLLDSSNTLYKLHINNDDNDDIIDDQGSITLNQINYLNIYNIINDNIDDIYITNTKLENLVIVNNIFTEDDFKMYINNNTIWDDNVTFELDRWPFYTNNPEMGVKLNMFELGNANIIKYDSFLNQRINPAYDSKPVRITNVADPIELHDCVSKKYVIDFIKNYFNIPL